MVFCRGRRRCLDGCSLGKSIWVMAKGKMTMRFLIILGAICFSANAFAQDAPPKAGTKTVKPKEPMGCKFVGTVKGTKLWAGDCAGPVLSGSAPATEANSPPKQ
jgi:hypothetical protein